LFPNAGLLFCIQVLQQYERRSGQLIRKKSSTSRLIFLGDMATLAQLYSNVFNYPLYIGLCLLLMLIYSVIYMFLAIYVERLNPGEFGISQPWNYIFKKSYWSTSSTVRPTDIENGLHKISNGTSNDNHWIELNTHERKKDPTMTIDHLNKVKLFHLIKIISEDLFI
jgi:hypothetical protein